MAVAVGGTARQVGIGAVAKRRMRGRVARLDLVAMHERDDPDDLVGSGLADDHQRLGMHVVPVGVPPGPMECPVGERCRPWIRGAKRVPDVPGNGVEVALARRAGRRDRSQACQVSQPWGPDRQAPQWQQGRSRPNASTGSGGWLRRQPRAPGAIRLLLSPFAAAAPGDGRSSCYGAQLNVQARDPSEILLGLPIRPTSADINFIVLPFLIVLVTALMASLAFPLGPASAVDAAPPRVRHRHHRLYDRHRRLHRPRRSSRPARQSGSS